MLSIGAPGRSFNVKPDTGGGKTGGGWRVDPTAETVRADVCPVGRMVEPPLSGVSVDCVLLARTIR